MKNSTNKTFLTQQSEHGNVLFLILIAVVLFAALSYAVTQSSRTGGGDAGRETNLINSATISQYPAAVKTAMVRMIINGTTYEELRFNPPSLFSALDGPPDITERGVFHPNGGGAVYVQAPADVMDSGGPGQWYFNPKFEVALIGTTHTGDGDGNEFIAFLPGIKQSICSKVNEEAGVASIPTVGFAASAVEIDYDTAFPSVGTIPDETAEIGDASNGPALEGQAYGCFQTTDATPDIYVYYQVLAER